MRKTKARVRENDVLGDGLGFEHILESTVI